MMTYLHFSVIQPILRVEATKTHILVNIQFKKAKHTPLVYNSHSLLCLSSILLDHKKFPLAGTRQKQKLYLP